MLGEGIRIGQAQPFAASTNCCGASRYLAAIALFWTTTPGELHHQSGQVTGTFAPCDASKRCTDATMDREMSPAPLAAPVPYSCDGGCSAGPGAAGQASSDGYVGRAVTALGGFVVDPEPT